MRDTRFVRSGAVTAMALSLVLAAGACAGEQATASSGSPSSASSVVAPAWSLSTEDSIAMAEDDKYVAPPEQYKIGQTLLITAKGPSPSTLVVIRDRELTIRNDTDIPQMLTFVNSVVDDKGNTSLGPIAPGEQLVYKPPFPISMVYTVDGDGIDGTLQVDTGEFSP